MVDPSPSAARETAAEHTVFGGESIEVVYRNSRDVPEDVRGKTEKVFLRDLGYRALHRFATCIRDDLSGELLEVCTGKPPGWSDLITIASAGRLAEACYHTNFPKALELSHKDPGMGVKLAPLLGGAYQAARLSDTVLGSSARLPAPASSGSVEATGSGSST